MARKLHNTEVEVKVLRTSQDGDHSQFLITDKNNYQLEEDIAINDVEILSNGEQLAALSSSINNLKKNRIND